jgi:hypothetical protein
MSSEEDKSEVWQLLGTAPFLWGKLIPQNPNAEALTVALQQIYGTPQNDLEREMVDFAPVVATIPLAFDRRIHDDFAATDANGLIYTEPCFDGYLLMACVRLDP